MTGPYGPPAGAPAQRPQITVRRGAPAPPPPPLPKRRGTRLPWIAGLLVLVVVAGAVGFAGFVSPGLLVRPEFAATGLQQGVQQTLRESYHLAAVESVRCPDGQPVEPGRTFACQVRLNGAVKSVPITVRDSAGLYEVGYPR